MKVLVLLLSASLVYGGVSLAKREARIHHSHTDGPHCYDKKDQQCYKKPKHETHEECHVEYDVVIDVTYIEECEHIEITTCEEEKRQVHKSSHEVGHDSKVVDEYEEHHYENEGHHKRSADPQQIGEQPGGLESRHHFGFNTGPHCQTKKDKQCSKHPKEESHKIPKTLCKKIVDTIYIEECEDIITTHCHQTSQQVHHSSAVVGQDSQVVSHGHGGYGYGKREAKADAKAEAEPGYGYSSGPQCQDKKDRQCHKKPVQNERKVPRPVCKTIVDTTYIEECEETFTTQCHTAHTQVHHSSAVVGHDSQVVAHGHSGYGGYGYQKREAKAEPEAKAEAEPGYGYSSGPQCHAKKDRQCHKKPVQNSHKVPRQVCVPVPREECHPIEIKVPRQVCNNFGYAVEHGSHHGHGYGYGR